MKIISIVSRMHEGAKRPSDDEGATVRVEVSSEGGFALLPTVGDFVPIDNSSTDMAGVNGRVPEHALRQIIASLT